MLNLISLDGHLDGFPADAGLDDELAARLPHQVVLASGDTMLAGSPATGKQATYGPLTPECGARCSPQCARSLAMLRARARLPPGGTFGTIPCVMLRVKLVWPASA